MEEITICMNVCVYWLLLGNRRSYRQIAGCGMGIGDHIMVEKGIMGRERERESEGVCVCVCVRVCVCSECVCLCVCEKEGGRDFGSAAWIEQSATHHSTCGTSEQSVEVVNSCLWGEPWVGQNVEHMEVVPLSTGSHQQITTVKSHHIKNI